ncbi:hypothetical protein [Spiroplasma sp. AdecLV25b]|uniref:hypothetical protein n=1 Tax=Spiroplasma sp. AdecLV25b TaxID=3027162 RepID=UPI0027E15EAD|nr:hypothetical protein [Spiroplasma sp. AdecLV25b]
MAIIRNNDFWKYIEKSNSEIQTLYSELQEKITTILSKKVSYNEKLKKIKHEYIVIANKLSKKDVDFETNIKKYTENQEDNGTKIINYDEVESGNVDVKEQIEKDKKSMKEFEKNFIFFNLAKKNIEENDDKINYEPILILELYKEFLTPSAKVELYEFRTREASTNFEFSKSKIYFEDLEKFVIKCNQAFKYYEQEVWNLNTWYLKRFEAIKESKDVYNQENNFEKLDRDFQNKRSDVFKKFEAGYIKLLPELEHHLIYNREELDYHITQTGYNAQDQEQKEQFQKFLLIKANLENFQIRYQTYYGNNKVINNDAQKLNKLHKQSVENKEKEYLKNSSQESQDFSTIGDEGIKEKIKYLEKYLLANKKIEDISSAITLFKSETDKNYENKRKIKLQKEYKIISASKDVFGDDYSIKEKNRMLKLNLFDVDASKVAVDNLAAVIKTKITNDSEAVDAAIDFNVTTYDNVVKAYDDVVKTYNEIIEIYNDDDIVAKVAYNEAIAKAKVAVDLATKDSNKIAQQLLLNEERKKLFIKFVSEARTSNYKFKDNIGTIELKTKKSLTWRVWNTVKSKTKWFFKTLLPWNAIKSAYNEIKQSINPYIFLKRNTEKLEALKDQLALEIDNIKLKYAKKMANGPGWKIWNLNKSDSYYLNEADKEIEDAIHKFNFKAEQIVKHYEYLTQKNIHVYSPGGRAVKKIEKFNDSLKLKYKEKKWYTSVTDIEELNDKLKELSENSKLKLQSPKIKELVESSNSLDSDIKNSIVNPQVL